MPLDIGEIPPDHENSWRITHVGRRAKWAAATEPCTVCDRSVDLNTSHYYVTLAHDPAIIVRRASDRELVFCGQRCLEVWGTGE
jgi:hypothetical protein